MTTPIATPPEQSVSVQDRFRQLAADWKRRSQYLSNTAQMAMLEPYQFIIGMGEPVLPANLEELRREPGHWFWALRAITQHDPVPADAAGDIRRMADAWIAWGERQGHLKA